MDAKNLNQLRMLIMQKVREEDDPALLEEVLHLFRLTGVEEPEEPYLAVVSGKDPSGCGDPEVREGPERG